ncbi:putative Peptidylprolyl isomerase [Rhodotorula taiwanensis]|uniref:Putative Peptidylprolyl isomerase n=1 Tax=Rhodotorula taiwanensis TaxID=741276 RepID=A0A2S5BET6_9BASI|nr:putative Peptidylprolyl isomerase [Rhodotorula taiwanensis]
MGHGNSDRLYITHAEHSGALGQHSASSRGAQAKNTVLAKLPFDHCALTLKPFETPVCTQDGTVYELMAIIPFLRLHGTDPMSGKKLAPGDLIKLNFARNNEGQYHDPITFKVFNDHTAIAAIKTTGNVYARESVDRLNLKPNNLHDLLTDEPFTRKDVIMLQDPLNLDKKDGQSITAAVPSLATAVRSDPFKERTVSKFDYVRRALKVDEDQGALSGINVEASGIGRVLKTLEKGKQDKAEVRMRAYDRAAQAKSDAAAAAANKVPSTNASAVASTSSSTAVPYNQAPISTNRAAAAFTSTSAAVTTKSENAKWDEEYLMYEEVKDRNEKGYARMVTNYGALNFELFANVAPKACYNFLSLARDGYYSNIKFHRLIPGFMLQGGDPTGTGRGGESRWGKPFDDEFQARNAYKHDQRGMLSMANSGPNTNGSQFFVTFRERCDHLNGKHTVFGRLVGGQDVLDKIERVPIDPATDRPLKPVTLIDVEVFGDPFEDYKERLAKRLKREENERAGFDEKRRRKEERDKDRTTWFGTNLEITAPEALSALGSSNGAAGIGKYLGTGAPKSIVAAGLKRKEAPTPSELVGELGGADIGSVAGGGALSAAAAKRKKKAGGSGFGDFSAW